MDWQSKRKVAVFGSWRPEGLSRRAIDWSYQLGSLIAKAEMILVTGGSGGVVLACRRGCRDAGGMNLAVLPDDHISDEMRDQTVVDIAVPTGLGVLGRMPILTESADYGIAVGGGAGTLVEVALTYLQRKIVVVVEGLRRRGDPAISRVLTRRSRVKIAGATAIRGYLDSKPEYLVRPIHVVNLVSPARALQIADGLYRALGTEPLGPSDVADRER